MPCRRMLTKPEFERGRAVGSRLTVLLSSAAHRWPMSTLDRTSRFLPGVATALAATATIATLGACSAQQNVVPSPSAAVSSPSAAPSSAPSAPTSPSESPVPAESNPPGDIPDNIAFVRYRNTPGGYSFTHPEGWAQTGQGSDVEFTDKLNGVRASSVRSAQPPTIATAKSAEVGRLQASVPAFELRDVAQADVPAGTAVRLVFRRNSDADPVTGKVYRDEVEEYLVYRGGRLVRMELFGPVGADNVDAYRTMVQSLEIR